MPSLTQDELRRDIESKLRELPPADWVREMLDYYRKTGTYRSPISVACSATRPAALRLARTRAYLHFYRYRAAATEAIPCSSEGRGKHDAGRGKVGTVASKLAHFLASPAGTLPNCIVELL